MINHETYEPTPEDLERLDEEGLTLEQAFQYDQPKNAQTYFSMGHTLLAAILLTDLRRNTLDALAQIRPLTLISLDIDKQERITAAARHFIDITRRRVAANPYPGKNFSKEKAQAVLAIAEKEEWTPENFTRIYEEILKILEEGI